MKKFLTTVIVVLALALLTACAKNAPALPDEPVTESTPESESVNIAVLKGPTAIATVNLMSKSDAGQTELDYDFKIAGTADEITADLIKGNIQIAAVPSNLASVLYNKSEGGVRVAAINNLGVLYVVELGDEINSVADLKGKTIYSTGKGTTPEYTLDYLLTMAGINPEKDVNIEFKSEATEIASVIAAAGEDKNIIAMLPQPYVTVVSTQNERAHIALDVTEEWNALAGSDSTVVTGVIAFNTAWGDAHPEALKTFLKEFEESAQTAISDVDGTAALVGSYDIFKEAIAKKAIPMCNIVSVEGNEMKTYISNYLQVLYSLNPASIGGKLPGDDFYYGAD